MKLPDQILVRYFRAGEIEQIEKVDLTAITVKVTLQSRIDNWRDLGGGIGYVPDPES